MERNGYVNRGTAERNGDIDKGRNYTAPQREGEGTVERNDYVNGKQWNGIIRRLEDTGTDRL